MESNHWLLFRYLFVLLRHPLKYKGYVHWRGILFWDWSANYIASLINILIHMYEGIGMQLWLCQTWNMPWSDQKWNVGWACLGVGLGWSPSPWNSGWIHFHACGTHISLEYSSYPWIFVCTMTLYIIYTNTIYEIYTFPKFYTLWKSNKTQKIWVSDLKWVNPAPSELRSMEFSNRVGFVSSMFGFHSSGMGFGLHTYNLGRAWAGPIPDLTSLSCTTKDDIGTSIYKLRWNSR